MLSHKGVGARLAWSVESRKVFRDLADLFGKHPVELVEFAEGEARRQIALDSYAQAREKGVLKMTAFTDSALFAEAIRSELKAWNASERLFVFMQDAERKGVYVTTQAALTECAIRLMTYDGSCVFFVSEDCAHGLLLDTEQVANAPACFELESW